MNEHKLRAGVAKRRKQLKRSEDLEVPDRTWDYLLEMGFVQDATETKDSEDEAVDYLVSCIDRLDRAAPSAQPKGLQTSADSVDIQHSSTGEEPDSKEDRYFEINLSEYEIERQRAFAEAKARYVEYSEDPQGNKEILNFREDFLNGSVLTDERAYALIESPAACYFHPAWFQEWELPILDHTSEITSRYEVKSHNPIDHRVSVRVEPVGATKRVRYSRPPEQTEDGDEIDMRMCVFTDPDRQEVKPPGKQPLIYRDRDGLKSQIQVWPGSLLDQIRGFSAKWARTYSWKEEDMLWLLLTGQAPKLNALTVRVRHDLGNLATVTLMVAPWVSAETVRRNYRNIQQQTIVGDNHALPLRSIAVVRFVERRIREAGERPPWPELLGQWNRQNPEWSYKDYRGLRQTYQRAVKKIAHPTLRMPESRPSPTVERRAQEAKDAAVRMLERAHEERNEPGE